MENFGTATYAGDRLRFGVSAQEPGEWRNKPGATFTAAGSNISFQAVQAGVFVNEGTFVKTGTDERPARSSPPRWCERAVPSAIF